MSKITLQQIEDKVTATIQEVKQLDISKADKQVISLELELIKKDIEAVKKDTEAVAKEQARVNSYGRWVIILIAGALITAVLNLIIKKQ